MRRVLIESPYAGEIERNTAYARAAMADCLEQGEAPFASHLLYTQPGILDDTKPEERKLGIAAGLCWGEAVDATVVYVDCGITDGMVEGIFAAIKGGRLVEFRSLEDWRGLADEPKETERWEWFMNPAPMPRTHPMPMPRRTEPNA